MASAAPAERRLSPIAGHGLFGGPHRTGDRVLGIGDLPHLNHSCDPNLGWWDADVLVARRGIAVGDELTVDYATHVVDPDFVLYCHCDTYRCRQVIEGTDWRIRQLQQRYAGHWAPAVQRLIDAQ